MTDYWGDFFPNYFLEVGNIAWRRRRRVIFPTGFPIYSICIKKIAVFDRSPFRGSVEAACPDGWGKKHRDVTCVQCHFGKRDCQQFAQSNSKIYAGENRLAAARNTKILRRIISEVQRSRVADSFSLCNRVDSLWRFSVTDGSLWHPRSSVSSPLSGFLDQPVITYPGRCLRYALIVQYQLV